ncbi:hypothetical protein PIB30_060463, partial [Stylosanthes scabra]|nr:hypothetical protein [Stylosanthes scabra]
MEESTSELGETNTQVIETDLHKEEEEEYIEYEENDVAEGIQKCKYSIVGKLITTKEINPIWVQSAMGNIWRKPKGFSMVEIKPKLYQFYVEKEADMRRILKGDPWLFRNAWLMVRKWERTTNPEEMVFLSAELKMQIWNLPEHCKTITLGKKIAGKVGE